MKQRSLIMKMSLGYKSIHVCKNYCVLFWNENSLKETCPVYSENCWKMQSSKRLGKKVPHKVLFYFPLGHTRKRLFVTLKTAKLIWWWHRVGKSTDNDVMQHSVDGRAGRSLIKVTLNLLTT